jgi:tetratricopeptide (TPR) repeat protein
MAGQRSGSTAAAERAALLLGVGAAVEALELVAPFLSGADDPAPHVVAVSALLASGRAGEAAQVAGAALEAFGPLPQLARVAGYAYLAAGDPGRAREAARWGVRESPEWVPGLLALVAAEAAAGDAAAAEGVLARAVGIAPEDPDVWLLAAELAADAGRVGDARRHLLTVLRVDPANTSAMRGLGVLDERRSRYGSAARWYAGALRLLPGDQELGTRVRALFGRFLGMSSVALVAVGLVAFIAFMARADPAPERSGGGPAGPLFWALWVVGFGGSFVALAWYALRGAPRAVLGAFAAEVRAYRRVRRCVWLAVAHAVLVIATVLAAVAPVGEPHDRLTTVVALWFATMVALVGLGIEMRRTFGAGRSRPARAHPRDRLPADAR